MREARHLLNEISKQLEEAGCASPRLDANLLLQMALQTEERILMHHDVSLSPDQDAYLHTLIQQRQAGCPVSRLRGWREFYGLTFVISDATLDPRPDSECLVDAVLHSDVGHEAPLQIGDFGTGSGCLLISLLHHRPQWHGFGIDISAEALAIAQQNAVAHQLQNRAHFLQSDWDARLADETQFDVIISNPPYIAEADRGALAPDVVNYDPETALFAGEDGLSDYQKLMPIIARRLSPQGRAFVEIGQHQETDVVALAEQASLSLRHQHCDLSGTIRCLEFGSHSDFA